MNRERKKKQTILKDLGNGLILRRSAPQDVDALVGYHCAILGPNDEGLKYWIRDLMTRPHPTFHKDDFTIVEDTKTGKIVSSMNLISQTWSYGGVAFGVGRPEIVSTHPDYRGRGLIRAQFDVIHEWSRQRGEKLMGITGIPYFYRQFGYEMAVTLGGGRTGHPAEIFALGKGQKEPYRIRAARGADLSFIARTYKEANRRYLLADVRDKAMWDYELNGRHKKDTNWRKICVIEDLKGDRVGVFVHPGQLQGNVMFMGPYELKRGTSWFSTTPSVLRYIKKTGEQFAKQQKQEFRKFTLLLGADHPVYALFPERLPETRPPYAWYLRAPDLPDFLRHVSPVLEQRLDGSFMAGHSGKVQIGFYRSGVRLTLKRGRVKKVEPWQPSPDNRDRGHAAFPGLTFLQLLFGYRTLDELSAAFPDCWARGDGVRALLNILFPKQASSVWPIA
ncbi:MAG: GNAT family N-acetyltransferase [Planctomycetota bacterium]